MVFEKEISEIIRFLVPWVTISCLPGDVGVPIFLAHSLGVIISILNFTILDDAEFLSCRAFIRRPLLCYCRRFVSDYDPVSFSNQLVFIGPRLKWRFRQLSFSSASWFGDEIWTFDPGIVGSRIDIERKLMTSIIQTPVHNTGLRQGQRIWWRGIRLILFFRLYDGNFLACISLFSNKEFGRSLVVCLSFWGCLSGARFTRWHSPLRQSRTLAIIKEVVLFCCWGGFDGTQCHTSSLAKLWNRITSYDEVVGALFFSTLALKDIALWMRIRRSNQHHVWIYGHESDVLSFYLRLEGLVFMKGGVIVTNRQRRVLRFQQHDHEPFQSTFQNFLLSRVMRKAFRSLIYMMLAYYKCMKRGLNRFILLLVSLSFGKQGYFHFFIGIVSNSPYLFHRLYLNGSMYHVNSYD